MTQKKIKVDVLEMKKKKKPIKRTYIQLFINPSYFKCRNSLYAVE